MTPSIPRRLAALAAPEGLIFGAALLFARAEGIQVATGPFLDVYPYAVAATGLFLAWRFERARMVVALLVLALADRAAAWGLAGGPVVQAAAVLVPLDLAALSLMSERDLFSGWGAARILAVAVEVLLVAVLAQPAVAPLAAFLRAPLLPASWFSWTPLGQPALLAFAASLAVIATRTVLEPNATGRGFFWATAAAFTGFQFAHTGLSATFYFATAGLVLVVALIEASYFMAYRDDLTGLPGRRALDETLDRLGRQYAIAMVDVDHFKKFNDRHGHAIGDQVLRMVGGVLARVEGGRVFRYGGEEFAIVFPGGNAADCVASLEAVRAAVAGTPFVVRAADRPKEKPERKPPKKAHAELSVTVSIGVAERVGRTPPIEVIKAADQALYRAKRAGRNRVHAA